MKRYRLHAREFRSRLHTHLRLRTTIRAAATRLISEFKKRFRLLASQPLMGERRPDLAADLRSFSVGSYVILYRPTQGGIEIARVIHGAPRHQGPV